MSVSPLVHELAITRDSTSASGRLHHVCLWYGVPQHVSDAAELFREHGIQIEAGPGKHGIAHALFMYVREPGGNRIELYGDAGYLIFDPAWQPVTWHEEISSTGSSSTAARCRPSSSPTARRTSNFPPSRLRRGNRQRLPDRDHCVLVERLYRSRHPKGTPARGEADRSGERGAERRPLRSTRCPAEKTSFQALGAYGRTGRVGDASGRALLRALASGSCCLAPGHRLFQPSSSSSDLGS
jgi:glyoxalase/bleomycin resistance protein/dioxygenase superfamily protein